jgi:hypothetical protein
MAMNNVGVDNLSEQGWGDRVVALPPNIPGTPYYAPAKFAALAFALVLTESYKTGGHFVSHKARQLKRIPFRPTENSIIAGEQGRYDVQH